MTDLIRNYKLTLRGKSESDDSEVESQPLLSSSSSSPCQSYRSVNDGCIFVQDSETETDVERSRVLQTVCEIPPILLQKKQNRRLLFPSSYETPELDAYENIYEKYEYDRQISDLTSSRKSSVDSKAFLSKSCDPEITETHSSLVTIFAIWNTTVGTSLLAMSWGIEKTGLFPSIFIMLLMSAICFYTADTLLKINEKHGIRGLNWEVCDLCKSLLGRWAEILAKIFSLVVLIGANVVYWILMSNFFYNFVHFFHMVIFNPDTNPTDSADDSVLCPKNVTVTASNAKAASVFDQFWDLHSTVPIVLGVIMFPMLNWKSPTFFTKFNSLGTFSVLYLIVFVTAKASLWGINVPDWNVEFVMKPTFCALSGMLSLSYFIHNIIISIVRNNKHQEHNSRDLGIAFALITFTYVFIGVLYYITFPLPKFCIEDNILNNFNKFDVLTILARILLFFQLFTVFPLITYMLRNDVFANLNTIFKNCRFEEFTYGRVIILNLVLIVICVLFACFLPRIGTLIRYTGALSGMVYIFLLPSLLKIASLRKEGALTNSQLIFHSSIIIFGSLNLTLQFFISD